jgi:hypothetical protein
MKLTVEKLRDIIREEKEKLASTPEEAADDVEEVDAGDLAKALEQQIDYVKALKIKEARYMRKAKRLREQRKRLLTQKK